MSLCVVFCCVVLCCVMLRCVALRCVALRCVALCCVVCVGVHVVSVVCVCRVVLLMVVVCVLVCDTLKTLEKTYVDSDTPPCVRSKRPRVHRHHVHMLFNICAWCRYTRGRFERTRALL